MLQHLWTGPISNAAVDVVQGGKSVEVRPVGVSKVFPLPNLFGKTFSLLVFQGLFSGVDELNGPDILTNGLLTSTVPKGDRLVHNRLCAETLVLLLQVADRETEMCIIQPSSPSHL
jgi:hypothetical protein